MFVEVTGKGVNLGVGLGLQTIFLWKCKSYNKGEK